MELKNIFKMTKTDRYTQDGRDELAKLQETEDVKYKTGDISQKTGLQKQPDGSWAPPKKGGKPAEKKEAGSINRTPERIAKETAIMEALNLSTGEDNNLHKMSDETIERLYARTQEKPAAGKTTIRQGPNTKTLNETPAEHLQKNLDAYKGYQAYDMEELVLKPSGYKRQTSARIPSGGQSITYTKEGEEDITLFFDKDGELENADVSAESKPTGTGTPAQKSPKEIIATPGKLATQEQTDAATAIADKNSYSFETMMEKFPIQKIQQFANSKVDDFEGGIDEYIEFKAEGRTGVDMEEVGKDFAKLINHNVARRIWNGYTNGSLKVDEKGFFKPAASIDSAPRILTGDTRIRVKK